MDGEDRVPQISPSTLSFHLATALSVVVVFHREVAQVLTGVPRLASPSTWKRDFDGHAADSGRSRAIG
jgi:undecaprenyl pyrophosphate phosphatase UppP